MVKVLFINGTARGHLNPTFPLVRELARRKEEVFYFSTREFRQQIEAAGATFMDYGPGVEQFLASFRPSGAHPFYTLVEFLLRQDEAMAQAILEQAGDMRFDYIVHDAMMGGGNIVAKALGLPAVCSCTSFAAEEPPVPPQMLARGSSAQLDGIYDLAGRINQQYGMQIGIKDIFFKKEKLNLVFTSRLFQPGGEGFDASYRFVGPSIEDRGESMPALPGRPGAPLVYISMGTINNGSAGFYQTCFEAFAEEDVAVAMSVGNKIDISSLGPVPSNFIVRSHMPQLEILKRAAAFISHGGLNSVSESLWFGVPVVAIPQANDQPAVARRLASLGAGLQLKPQDATPAVLRESLQSVITEPSYRAACAMIGDSFREAGGYKAAADHLLCPNPFPMTSFKSFSTTKA